MNLDLLKSWKIWLLVVMVLIAIALISPNISPRGFEVVAKTKNSTISVSVGDIIYSINGNDATIDDFSRNYSGIISILTNKGEKFVTTNGTLGIDVRKVSSTRLKFGLDIEGGVKAVLEPNITTGDNQTFENVMTTLQYRIDNYGLRETVVLPVFVDKNKFIEVSIAGGSKEELKGLLEDRGEFA